ncbi:MAG: DMT family transporter [Ferruginibacter sp.]
MDNSNSSSTALLKKNIYIGVGLAVLATLLWSVNFIIAKGITRSINPISLSFYRWLIASIVIMPFAIKQFISQWRAVQTAWQYLFWASLTGVAFFNTFVYIGAHYTSAINLALIGTTSSPIMSVAFARIFLKEKIGPLKFAGMILCAIGVLFLLSKGSFQNLLHLHFGTGDLWVLLAAFSFAVYNTLVKKKPATISPVNFLFTSFSLGTMMMLPFFLYELNHSAPVEWSGHVIFSVLYLGIIASVICFLIWNMAIDKLGAGRTALFGNLIPVFSSIEAAFILQEDFTWIHITSMSIVFAGILLANLRHQ